VPVLEAAVAVARDIVAHGCQYSPWAHGTWTGRSLDRRNLQQKQTLISKRTNPIKKMKCSFQYDFQGLKLDEKDNAI
jgi:hypothetical protein